MPVNNLNRLILYFALYQATVGIFEAWDEAYEPSYLNSKALSQTLIATSQSIAFLPWAFKMIFSFISDKFNFFGYGWRRPYCVIGLLTTGACFMILTTFSPADYFPLYILVMVLRNCAIALADGATEGLSVDAGIEESSGAVQAWMMCGRMIGMMAGSAAGGPIAAQSYQACMAFLGVSIACFAPINYFIKEERTRGGSSSASGGAAYAKVGMGLSDDESGHAPVVNLNSTDMVDASPSAQQQEESSPGGSYAAPGLDGSPSYPPTTATGDEASSTAGGGAVHKSTAQLTEFQVLMGQLREVPIFMLILFTFVTNLGTYVASFPIVVWSESKHNMDIQDIGWLTVSSAIGNMCFSVPMGYLFDRVHNKQALLYASSLLAGAAYFTFPAAQGKYAVFAAQALIAGGTGALYTVQCSIVRLVADERVGASMFAAVLGAMNLAAFLGTLVGGPIADADMELCYWIGGICACLGVLFVPWIKVNSTYAAPTDNLPEGVMKPNEIDGGLAASMGIGLGAGMGAPDSDGLEAGAGSGRADLPLLVSGDSDVGELERSLAGEGAVSRTLRQLGLPVG